MFVMKRVLVFGTFDFIHPGHKYFFRQAKKCGDFLIAVVTRDMNVKKQKDRFPVNDEKIRLQNVKKLKIVNKALLGERTISYNLIKKIKPDVICIGYDQEPSIYQAKEILRKLGMERIVLKRIKAFKPEIYKSSLVQKKY